MTWVAIAIAFFVATMERWSVAEVSEFLVVNGFDEEAVELFRRNKIRGKVLKLLTDRDLQEMGLTAIGDRRLLNHLLQVCICLSSSITVILFIYIYNNVTVA